MTYKLKSSHRRSRNGQTLSLRYTGQKICRQSGRGVVSLGLWYLVFLLAPAGQEGALNVCNL